MCFFQAEDGIRDIGVTGVQTCALPISRRGHRRRVRRRDRPARTTRLTLTGHTSYRSGTSSSTLCGDRKSVVQGKSVDLGGRRIIKKKNHTPCTSPYSVPTLPANLVVHA